MGTRNLVLISVFATVIICLFFAQTASALSVVATITVGNVPTYVAYDSAKGEVFVANDGSNSVSVISDTTNSVVATVSYVGSNPFGVTYDSGKGEVFVANSGSNNVSVINDSNNAKSATFTVN